MQNLSFVANRVMLDYSYHRETTRDPTIFPDRDHERSTDAATTGIRDQNLFMKNFLYSPAKGCRKVKDQPPRSVPANI